MTEKNINMTTGHWRTASLTSSSRLRMFVRKASSQIWLHTLDQHFKNLKARQPDDFIQIPLPRNMNIIGELPF